MIEAEVAHLSPQLTKRLFLASRIITKYYWTLPVPNDRKMYFLRFITSWILTTHGRYINYILLHF
jgi:hypothetical protein